MSGNKNGKQKNAKGERFFKHLLECPVCGGIPELTYQFEDKDVYITIRCNGHDEVMGDHFSITQAFKNSGEEQATLRGKEWA